MARLAFNPLAGVSPSVAAFESLFPVPTVSPPTPTVTPRIGSAPDSQSFGESGDDSIEPLDDSSLAARRYVALSRAKSFLGVVAVRQGDLSSTAVQQMRENLKSNATPHIETALKLLLADWPDNRMVEDDLVSSFLVSNTANSRSWNGTRRVSGQISVSRWALICTTCGLECVWRDFRSRLSNFGRTRRLETSKDLPRRVKCFTTHRGCTPLRLRNT